MQAKGGGPVIVWLCEQYLDVMGQHFVDGSGSEIYLDMYMI